MLQVPATSGDGTPAHADSSCIVITTAEASAALADVAQSPSGCAADGTSMAGSCVLKPPVSSSSPDIALAKGPLTAARPANRRPPQVVQGNGGPLQLGRQSTDGAAAAAAAAAAGTGGAHRKLSFGLGDVGHSDDRGRGQAGDFFSRMFSCLTPRVAEVA